MNRLALETSPYLRQHQDNPVDWYPWGDDAFAKAVREDKPILLSVGYSACHWCHVMAHESFEDAGIAQLVNEGFVAVKVDREERPDVDALYMAALLATTGRGGWPMTVFLTPDGRPFYAGTYFPPETRGGMPGLRSVLTAVSDAWRHRRQDVEDEATAVTTGLARQAAVVTDISTLEPLPAEPVVATGPLAGHAGTGTGTGRGDMSSSEAADLLDGAVTELTRRFDAEWGGFSGAPKFPQPELVEICLRHHRLTGEVASLDMATTTLAAMAAGGIYDHLGGGFARYSTDVTWTVPHFEKMLYDQAGLLRSYLHAWQMTADPRWLQVIEETVRYVASDLTDGSGGVCSSRDADSDGMEGAYYLWTPDQLIRALGAHRADIAAEWYGVTRRGNFEGQSILRRPIGAPLERPPEVEDVRRILLDLRDRREPPMRDYKVLTEWNAMYASALAEAAGATGMEKWALQAEGIARFLLENLRRRSDGRWLRSWALGEARHLACSTDYAWLIDCFTRMAELTGQPAWLDTARQTADDLITLFTMRGGLATTGSDADALVVRTAETTDGSLPAAAAVAGAAIVRLGALLDNRRLTESGISLLTPLISVTRRFPLAAPSAINAAFLAARETTEVVVTGSRPDLVSAFRRRYEPDAVLAWGERTSSGLWDDRDDQLAYVCSGSTCLPPVATVDELARTLDTMSGHHHSRLPATALEHHHARG